MLLGLFAWFKELLTKELEVVTPAVSTYIGSFQA